MEVHYCMTRRDAWRGNLYSLWRKPVSLVILSVYSVCVTGYFYWTMPNLQASFSLHSVHSWWVPALLFGLFGGQIFLTLFALRLQIDTLYPETIGPPVSVTILTPDGLQDSTRRKRSGETIFVPMTVAWKDMREIKWHEGDIYFRRKNGFNFVPLTAFENPRHAQQFYDTALAYWQSAVGSAPGAQTTETWPPAPQV